MPQSQPTTWNPGNYLSRKIKTVKTAVGQIPIVCAIGPGPRAAVVATILHQALGANVRFVFVDTGLSNKSEVARTLAYLRNDLGLKVWHADACDFFYSRMRGALSKEDKAHAADRTLVDSVIRAAADMQIVPVLVTDVAPGSGPDSERTQMYAQYDITLVDPLRGLTPEQVTELARFLEIPAAACIEPQLPLAGAAEWIEGEPTPAKLRAAREADSVIRGFWRAKKLPITLNVKVLNVAGADAAAGIALALEFAPHAEEYPAIPAAIWTELTNAIVRAVPSINRVFLELTVPSPAEA